MVSHKAATVLVAVVWAASVQAFPNESKIPAGLSQSSTPSNDSREPEIQNSTQETYTAQTVNLDASVLPEPSSSLSLVVYAAVLLTILGMVYLVVRNFRYVPRVSRDSEKFHPENSI